MAQQAVDSGERRRQLAGGGDLSDVDTLTFRIGQVREDMALLQDALETDDRQRAILIAVRLRHGLKIVERTAIARAIADTVHYDEIITPVLQLQDEAEPLLDLVPEASQDVVPIRHYLARTGTSCLSRHRPTSNRAVEASNETLTDLILKHADLQYGRMGGAILRNVRAHEANLSRLFAPGITLIRVDFWASRMCGATLDSARAEESCFAMAAMTCAAMHRATITRCDLRGAVLCDVSLERAALIACDLRGATFAASRWDAGTIGAQFIACDLRGTSWDGRDLAGVRFEDCKMSGLRGRPRTDGIVIVRPDLSAAGDGSVSAPVISPEALWLGAA